MAACCGCELLVDVNNIDMNALNEHLAEVGIVPLVACVHWISQIPAHLVGEVHPAGHVDCGDIVIDDQGSRVCNAFWQIYQHAQQRFGNVPALLEWDTDISPFRHLPFFFVRRPWHMQLCPVPAGLAKNVASRSNASRRSAARTNEVA